MISATFYPRVTHNTDMANPGVEKYRLITATGGDVYTNKLFDTAKQCLDAAEKDLAVGKQYKGLDIIKSTRVGNERIDIETK